MWERHTIMGMLKCERVDDDNSVYSYNIMIMIMIKNKFDTRTITTRKNVMRSKL